MTISVSLYTWKLNCFYNQRGWNETPAFKYFANCNFIEKGENLFFVGPTGVGKTLLASGIGHEACRRGYDVLYKKTSVLLDWLHSGNGDGTFQKKMYLILPVMMNQTK